MKYLSAVWLGERWVVSANKKNHAIIPYIQHVFFQLIWTILLFMPLFCNSHVMVSNEYKIGTGQYVKLIT